MSTNSSKKQMTKKTFFLDENINMCVEEAMQKAKKGLKEKPDEMALGYICFNFVADDGGKLLLCAQRLGIETTVEILTKRFPNLKVWDERPKREK